MVSKGSAPFFNRLLDPISAPAPSRHFPADFRLTKQTKRLIVDRSSFGWGMTVVGAVMKRTLGAVLLVFGGCGQGDLIRTDDGHIMKKNGSNTWEHVEDCPGCHVRYQNYWRRRERESSQQSEAPPHYQESTIPI